MTAHNPNATVPALITASPSRCSLAQTPEDRELVFRLRHEAYRRDESIDPQPDGRFPDHFDACPNHFSFLLRDDSAAPKATVRLSIVRPDVAWLEAPSRTVFGGHPVLDAITAESYVEANRLCFGPSARRDSFVQLLGYMAAASDFFDTPWLIACPRVAHASAYTSLFGFRPLAEPRQYFGVRFETQLLGIRREEIRLFVRDRAPMRNAWLQALLHLESLPCLSSLRRH